MTLTMRTLLQLLLEFAVLNLLQDVRVPSLIDLERSPAVRTDNLCILMPLESNVEHSKTGRLQRGLMNGRGGDLVGQHFHIRVIRVLL